MGIVERVVGSHKVSRNCVSVPGSELRKIRLWVDLAVELAEESGHLIDQLERVQKEFERLREKLRKYRRLFALVG
jgi:hypothetical protein